MSWVVNWVKQASELGVWMLLKRCECCDSNLWRVQEWYKTTYWIGLTTYHKKGYAAVSFEFNVTTVNVLGCHVISTMIKVVETAIFHSLYYHFRNARIKVSFVLFLDTLLCWKFPVETVAAAVLCWPPRPWLTLNNTTPTQWTFHVLPSSQFWTNCRCRIARSTIAEGEQGLRVSICLV